MSAAGSQVRQGAAVAARAQSQQPAPRAAARQAPMHAFVSSDIEDEFRLHLNDIPRQRESLEVEGLKPSLLSRLLDMVSPLDK